MKRFYKLVTTAPEAQGFAIHLDGKPVKTPSRQILISPTQEFANEIMKEWMAQTDVIDPETMPLTQILTTAMDCAEADKISIAHEVLGYLDTDLLCYRAIEPPAVMVRQEEIWGPWLSRFEKLSGAKMLTTTDLIALKQPQAAHDYVTDMVNGADDRTFTVLQMVTAISGSLIMALAFIDGAATPDDVFQVAQLEELYRSEIYNEDFYGKAPHQEKSQAGIIRDLNALRVFLDTTK